MYWFLPREVWIVAFDEMTKAFSDVFDELDALEGSACALQAFFSLGGIGGYG
jgi:hypothetical protein